MRIKSHSLETFDIRLTKAISTGSGALGDRSGLRITFVTDEGLVGVGETAPIPGRPRMSPLEMVATEVRTAATWCESKDLGELASSPYVDGLGNLARFAVHTALVDLLSQEAGLPVSTYLNPAAGTSVNTNALVAAESPDEVFSETKRAVQAGFKAVKLKVGGLDRGADVVKIVAASEACGSDVELRLDVNGAWDVDTATHVIGRVGALRIGYVEDPAASPADCKLIAEECDVSVAVDADPRGVLDVEETLAAHGASVLVAKPVAVGGLDRILQIGQQLQSGQRLVVSSSIDGDVGLRAGIHAAAALDNAENHGLATAKLVRGLSPELEPARGKISLPVEPGIRGQNLAV